MLASTSGDTPINITPPDRADAPDSDLASGTALPGQDLTRGRLAALADELHNADFLAALRLLEACHPAQPRIGSAAQLSSEFVRLSQRPSTGFQGNAMDTLEEVSDGAHQYRLFCNFFGLMGTNGPLPLHYSEYADQRARHEHDPTFREFLDMFNHRMLSLYYRAMAEVDPSINQDRPSSNSFSSVVGSVAGLLPSQARARDGFADTAKLFYAVWMGSRSKSPDAIAGIVSEYFGVSATVREFVGGWLPLPASDKSRLGGARGNFSLGQSSYIGHRVWSVSHKFVLVIEALTWAQFCDLQPGGRRSEHLFDLVRNLIGDEWDWDLQLQLARGEAQPLRLDHSRILGFSSFVVGTGMRTGRSGNPDAGPRRHITLNKKLLQRRNRQKQAHTESG